MTTIAWLLLNSAAVGAPLAWDTQGVPAATDEELLAEIRWYRSDAFRARIHEEIRAIAFREASQATPDPAQAVTGFADLHAHVFSEAAFGRRVIVDAPAGSCDGDNHGLTRANNALLSFQPSVKSDPMMSQLQRHKAASDYNGWDQWTHDQYTTVDLRLAHERGARIIVMSAVNAVPLCAITRSITPDAEGRSLAGTDPRNAFDCGDDVNIHRQIALTLDMAAENASWMEVVLSPEGARSAIERGKLAVVLGVEGDDYLDAADYGGIGSKARIDACLEEGNTQDCAKAAEEVVTELWRLGIRVVIPIHEWTNAAGGASVHLPSLFQAAYARREIPPHYYDELGPFRLARDFFRARRLVNRATGEVDKIARPQSPAESARRGERFTETTERLKTLPMPLEVTETGAPDSRRYLRGAEGLSPYGMALITAISHCNSGVTLCPGGGNLILDLTHFSDRTFEDLEELANSAPLNVPVIISHGPPRSLSHRPFEELEFPNSREKYEWVAARGGTIALQVANDDLHLHGNQTPPVDRLVRRVSSPPSEPWQAVFGGVTCPGSVDSFDLGIQYLLTFTDRVALGTDFNGGALAVVPTSGEQACRAAYSTPERMEFGRLAGCLAAGPGMERLETDGVRSFAYVPDLLEATRGSTRTALDRSASSFLASWATEPTIEVDQLPPAAGHPLGDGHWSGAATSAKVDACLQPKDMVAPDSTWMVTLDRTKSPCSVDWAATTASGDVLAGTVKVTNCH